MFDCIIIGGGVVGCAVLDVLARYDITALLLEKDDDVASGASRANSGIVHAGYDCEPNTQKALFNVQGNKMMENLAKELDVPFKKAHSIVVGKADQLDRVKALYEKGVANGVKVEILNREATLKIEPNVADDIEWSLYAEDAGVISPYKLTIALADRAVTNGAKVLCGEEVKAVEKTASGYAVKTQNGEYNCKIVINCAGGAAARINDLAGAEHYETEFRRGDYFVLDQTEGCKVQTVIFPLPTAAGKGILVAPTADGNVIYGPTSISTTEGDTAVTLDGLDQIKAQVAQSYKCPNYRKIIRLYAGVRAAIGHDFIVKKSEKLNNFIFAAGICSPGLSSAPAIAVYIGKLVGECMDLKQKSEYVVDMPKHLRLKELAPEKLVELAKADSRWGRIVCRCEKVTEAEIVNAIHSPLPATTVDAVKRRVRAGMGRCQGGFCAPRVMQILSRELNIPYDKVKKGGENSEIAVCKIKEANEND